LNFTIRTSRVNGARRIEIVGAEAARIPELKALGCFTEIIAYKTRVFVPIDRVEVVLLNLARSGGDAVHKRLACRGDLDKLSPLGLAR